MGTVKAIEKPVEALPAEELAEFRRWFAAFHAAACKAQLETDAVEGKLDALAQEALAEYRTGSARPL